MAALKVCGVIVSFFFFLLSFVAFVAAFSGTYWMKSGSTHWGLWKVCTGDLCSATVGTDIMTAPFIGAQVLMCVALMLGVVALGSYMAWLATQRPKPCVIAWAAHVASGFCMGIGLLCWGNESIRYYGVNVLDWSFWLALASCVMTILNAGITACITGCGVDLENEAHATAYSAATGHPGGVLYNYGAGPHNTSDQEYSDITSSEINVSQPKGPPGEFNLPPAKNKYRY